MNTQTCHTHHHTWVDTYMCVHVCKCLVGMCWTGKIMNLLKGPGITQYLKKVGGVKRCANCHVFVMSLVTSLRGTTQWIRGAKQGSKLAIEPTRTRRHRLVLHNLVTNIHSTLPASFGRNRATGASTWWQWQSPQADNENATHKEGEGMWMLTCCSHWPALVPSHGLMCMLYKKVSSYISQHPVLRTAQNTFTLYFRGRPVQSNTISTSLGSRMLRLNAQRLLIHIYTSVYSQVLIYTANWSNVEWKNMPKVLTPQHRIRTRVLLVESPKFYPWAIAFYRCMFIWYRVYKSSLPWFRDADHCLSQVQPSPSSQWLTPRNVQAENKPLCMILRTKNSSPSTVISKSHQPNHTQRFK